MKCPRLAIEGWIRADPPAEGRASLAVRCCGLFIGCPESNPGAKVFSRLTTVIKPLGSE